MVGAFTCDSFKCGSVTAIYSDVELPLEKGY